MALTVFNVWEQGSRWESLPAEPALALVGDCRRWLQTLPDDSIDCIVTSPPYWGLRAYSGHPDDIGSEPTLALFLSNLTTVFSECRRVLKPSGTCWINMGDAYAGTGKSPGRVSNRQESWERYGQVKTGPKGGHWAPPPDGLKRKDLMGQPWRLAFALQDIGWWLRSEIIWEKPNPAPESVSDRPTKVHEQIFLLTKRRRYFYNAAAIAEPVAGTAHPRARAKAPDGWAYGEGVRHTAAEWNQSQRAGEARRVKRLPSGAREGAVKYNESMDRAVTDLVDVRNARSIWRIPAEPYLGPHYATFPRELPRRCIAAGCPPGGWVLDPFGGSGTTAEVARMMGRNVISIDTDPAGPDMLAARLRNTAPPDSGEQPDNMTIALF